MLVAFEAYGERQRTMTPILLRSNVFSRFTPLYTSRNRPPVCDTHGLRNELHGFASWRKITDGRPGHLEYLVLLLFGNTHIAYLYKFISLSQVSRQMLHVTRF